MAVPFGQLFFLLQARAHVSKFAARALESPVSRPRSGPSLPRGCSGFSVASGYSLACLRRNAAILPATLRAASACGRLIEGLRPGVFSFRFPLPLPPFGTPLWLTLSFLSEGIHKGGSTQKGQRARTFTQPSALAIYFAAARSSTRCSARPARHDSLAEASVDSAGPPWPAAEG